MLSKNLNLLWSTFNAMGEIFIVANGLILTNNIAIWSHWSYPTPEAEPSSNLATLFTANCIEETKTERKESGNGPYCKDYAQD